MACPVLRQQRVSPAGCAWKAGPREHAGPESNAQRLGDMNLGWCSAPNSSCSQPQTWRGGKHKKKKWYRIKLPWTFALNFIGSECSNMLEMLSNDCSIKDKSFSTKTEVNWKSFPQALHSYQEIFNYWRLGRQIPSHRVFEASTFHYTAQHRQSSFYYTHLQQYCTKTRTNLQGRFYTYSMLKCAHFIQDTSQGPNITSRHEDRKEGEEGKTKQYKVSCIKHIEHKTYTNVKHVTITYEKKNTWEKGITSKFNLLYSWLY